MTIKIPVRADIDGIKSDLETLTREAEKVSRALGNKRPEIDISRAQEALKRLWVEANKLESKLQKPGKIDLGVAEASEQLVRAREEAERLARAIHGDKTNSAYSRATREAREYHRTISGIIHDQHRLSDLLRREVVGAGGSILGSVMPGFGNVAGTASRFAAGSGSVAGMIGRGALGAGVGASLYGAYKVAQHIPAAEQEAISTSVLRSTIGGLTADFNALRDAARNIVFDGGLGVTSAEMLGLERQYSKIAGGRGVNALTSETAEAIKIARAMGLEPGEGVGFFGASQRFRAAGSDEQSQRRFANMIGESVARVGFAQSSEVLQAIAGFMGSSARSIVGPAAGTEEYSSMLAKLTGPGSVYGQDIGGGASLMARMSAGFQSGFAGAGPAGQAFALGVLQSQFSRQFSAVDVAGIMQAGPFSSLRDAIGPNSVMYRSADAATQARYMAMLKEAGSKADAPMLDMFVRGIESSVPAALVNDAMARAFQINVREAAAFRVAAKQHGGTAGIQARLRAMGIDTSDPVKTINLAKYLNADRGELMREAKRFTKEGVGTSELKSAMEGNDTEKLRQEVTKIASSQDLKDDGEKTRDSIAKVETALTELASKLLPAQEAIRQAVLFAAGKTPGEFAKWQTKNVTGPFDGVIGDAQDRISDRSGQLRLLNEKIRVSKELASHGYGKDEYAAMLKKRSELEQANAADRSVINRTKIDRDAALIRAPSMYDSIFAEAGRETGIDPAILKAIAVHKSHLNPDAINVNQNGSGNYGIMQLNSRGAGAGLSREQLMDPRTNIMAGSKFFAELVKKHGYYEALKQYNGTGAAAERYRKEMLETLGRAGIDIHDQLTAEHQAKTGADKISMHTIMQGTYEEQRKRLKELEVADAADRAIIKNAEEQAMAQARKSRRLMELKSTRVTTSEAAAIRGAAKKHGVPENWFYKALALENSGANAVSPAGARGRFQLMPGNLLPGEDPTSIESSANAVGRVFRDAMKLYGPDEDAIFAYYNGGKKAGDAVHAGKPAPYKETRNYLNRLHKIKDPLPDGHRAKTGADKLGSLNISGQFTLRDSQGLEVADPVQINHRYSLPNTGLA